MTEMIERVARALYESHSGKSDWDDSIRAQDPVGARYRDEWRELARAAIEAMRPPTLPMATAGDDAADDYWNRSMGETVWRAMIDAALTP